MTLSSLQSRHVVITGASRGIGRGVAEACARAGARLTLCARSEGPLTELSSRLAAVGGILDVRDPSAVSDWLAAGVRQNGPIDVVFNNAALLGPKVELADYPLADWQQVMTVNVDGSFVVTQQALPHMKRPGGALIFMTSFLGRNAIPRFGAYCASKFAIEGLSRLVHEEHHAEGLISVCLDPGMVATDMLVAAQESDDVAAHPTPEAAGERFVQLIAGLTPAHSGQGISLFE
ncbi:MAG: NAD(P)-dependent dehydrogenase (short-subunit alcohol dehydrogenase family) [Myxococcota bacterium]|jgi:NAD(P)-dependent dehydrogenase (short-subunit alcohol dehydrogenase family)